MFVPYENNLLLTFVSQRYSRDMGTASSCCGLCARPESRAFLEKLNGFLSARQRLNSIEKAALPEGLLLNKFEELTKDVMQDVDGLLEATSLEEQLDLLYGKAHEASMRLGEFCSKAIREATEEDPHREMLRQSRGPGKEDRLFYIYTSAPLKSRERAVEKIKKEYGGDGRKVLDIVRASIVFDSEASLAKLLRYLKKNYWNVTLLPSTTSKSLLNWSSSSRKKPSVLSRFLSGMSGDGERSPRRSSSKSFRINVDERLLQDVVIVRFKDRFSHPTFSGYRDALLNLKIPLADGDSLIVELQIHHRAFLAEKAETHLYYEYFRTYFAGNVDVVGERMAVLESLARGSSEGAATERLYADALESGDECKLRALDDLLDKLSELDLRGKVCERLVGVAKENYGENTTDYAMALANLGELLRAKGETEKAEKKYREALKIYHETGGSSDKNVAAISNNLALNLTASGNFQEAEQLFTKSLTIREQVFGKESMEVAQSLNNMALLLKTTGREKESIPCYERAIAIKERQSEDTPSLATSFINLGSVLSAQGAPHEAMPYFEKAYAIAEKSFGKNHPSALTAQAWIGDTYRRKGDTEKALEILQDVVRGRERALGPEHQDVASALTSVAGVISQLGRHDEAQALYERSLAIREKKFSEDHPDVAKTLNSLARLCKAQNKLQEAEPYYRRSLQIREASLGGDHPSVAESANNLAGLLASLGHCAEATSHYHRAIAIWERTLGPDHPDLATTLNNLALVLWRLDRLSEAVPLQARALAIRQRRGDTRDADEYQQELTQMQNKDVYPYE